MRPLRHLTLTAILAVALLLGTAVPSAAGGPYPFPPFGTATVTTALGVIPLVTPAGAPCPPRASTLSLFTDNDATPPGIGRWSTSGGFATQIQVGGIWYQVDFTMTMSGTYTANPMPPPNYFMAGTILFQMRFYQLAPPNCAKNNLRCTATGRMVITQGSYFGTLPNAGPMDWMNLQATTNAVGGLPLVVMNCAPPFVALAGTHATLA
jgi:hypothetical protein